MQAIIHGNILLPDRFADGEALPEAKHVFTHLIWRMRGWHVRADRVPEGAVAADAEGLRTRAFPSALRRYHEIALELVENPPPIC